MPLPPIVARRRQYKNVGETAGALAGAVAGGLTPLFLGGETGEAMMTHSVEGADQINEYLGRNTISDVAGPVGAKDIVQASGDAGRLGGTLVGASLAPLTAIGGGMLGASAGRTLGRETAGGQTMLMPAVARAREFVRTMPRGHGLALRDAALAGGNREVVRAIDDEMRRSKIAAGFTRVRDLIDAGGAPKPQLDISGTGEAIGRGLGSLYGIGMAMGAPVVGTFAGESIGNSLATLGHAVGDHYDVDLAGPGEAARALGKPIGALAGGALGLTYLAARSAAPATLANVGGTIGHRFGSLFSGLVPRHQQIASRVYDAPPEHAYAYLKGIESDPNARPGDLDVARKAYDFRRTAAQGLLKAAAYDWSSNDPARPSRWRSGMGIGALAGGALGAIGAPLLIDASIQPEIDPETQLPATEDSPGYFRHLGNRLSDTNRAHIQTAALGTGLFAGSLAGAGIGAGLGALRDAPTNQHALGQTAYRATGTVLPGLAAGGQTEIDRQQRYQQALSTAQRSIAQGA